MIFVATKPLSWPTTPSATTVTISLFIIAFSIAPITWPTFSSTTKPTFSSTTKPTFSSTTKPTLGCFMSNFAVSMYFWLIFI